MPGLPTVPVGVTADAMMSHDQPGKLALFRMDQLACIDAKSLPDHEESLFPNWLCFALFSRIDRLFPIAFQTLT